MGIHLSGAVILSLNYVFKQRPQFPSQIGWSAIDSLADAKYVSHCFVCGVALAFLGNRVLCRKRIVVKHS